MIKKLQVNQFPPPSDPMPKEYEDINLNTERPTLQRNSNNISVKDFMDLDLTRLPSLKLLLKDLKAKEMLEELNNSMNHVLNIEAVGGNTESMKKEIIIYIMEEIEKFLLKPKSGSEKKSMAIEILKKLFHNDVIATGIVIDGLMPKLRQVGLIRRLFYKACRYFRKKNSE